MNRIKLLTALSIAGILPGLAGARPIELPGSANLKNLIAGADIIFRGKVDSVKDDIATITVERAYKGASADEKIQVTFDSANQGCGQIIANERAIFLLKKANGKRILIDCQHGKIRTGAGKGKKAGSPEELLAGDLESSVASGTREERISAIQSLVALKRRDATSSIKEQISSPDTEIKLTARWALLKLGDITQLDSLDQDLKANSKPSGVVIWSIGKAVSDVSDNKAVPALERLSHSHNPQLMQASVRALRALHSPSSAPRLVELLDSADRDVAYDAMAGLDMIKNGEMSEIPSMTLFAKDSEKYIKQWKDWWQKAGKAKYGQ